MELKFNKNFTISLNNQKKTLLTQYSIILCNFIFKSMNIVDLK